MQLLILMTIQNLNKAWTDIVFGRNNQGSFGRCWGLLIWDFVQIGSFAKLVGSPARQGQYGWSVPRWVRFDDLYTADK